MLALNIYFFILNLILIIAETRVYVRKIASHTNKEVICYWKDKCFQLEDELRNLEDELDKLKKAK